MGSIACFHELGLLHCYVILTCFIFTLLGHVSDVRNNMSHPVQCNRNLIPSISPVSSRDESSLDTSASLSTRRQSSAQVESNVHPVNESEHHQVLGSTHSSYTLQFSLSGSQTLSSPSSQW